MANAKSSKNVRLVSFAYIHKLAAAVSLLAFVVIGIAGAMAQASVYSIAMRAAVVIIVVSLVSRVLIKVLASYEEMNSGKA